MKVSEQTKNLSNGELLKGYRELESDWLINKIHFARDLAAIVTDGAFVNEVQLAGKRAAETVN